MSWTQWGLDLIYVVSDRWLRCWLNLVSLLTPSNTDAGNSRSAQIKRYNQPEWTALEQHKHTQELAADGNRVRGGGGWVDLTPLSRPRAHACLRVTLRVKGQPHCFTEHLSAGVCAIVSDGEHSWWIISACYQDKNNYNYIILYIIYLNYIIILK